MDTAKKIKESVLDYQENLMTCPECKAKIKTYCSFENWCEFCDWNLSQEREESKDIFTRIYEKINAQKREKFFQEFVIEGKQVSEIKYKVALYVFSTFVYLIPFLFLFLGFYFFSSRFFVVKYVFSGLCVAIAHSTLPRFPKFKGKLLTRKEAPKTFKLIDAMASKMQAKTADYLCLDETVNAFYTQVGFKQEKVVGLGMPHLNLLSDDELLFTFGHELAHGKNNDFTRLKYISRSFYTLSSLYELIMPERLYEPSEGFYAVCAIPGKLIMAGLAQLIYLLMFVGQNIFFNLSQLEEYNADKISSSIVGSKVSADSLKKIKYSDYFYFFTYKYAQKNYPKLNLYESFVESLDLLPEKEKLKIDKNFARELNSIDYTHPATQFRIRAIESYGDVSSIENKELVSMAAKARIELNQLGQDKQVEIIDTYLDRIQ